MEKWREKDKQNIKMEIFMKVTLSKERDKESDTWKQKTMSIMVLLETIWRKEKGQLFFLET